MTPYSRRFWLYIPGRHKTGRGPVIHKYNPEKDYTDTDIALKLAMEYCEGQAESQIWILGATGTRLDHVLANIRHAPFASEKRDPCCDPG